MILLVLSFIRTVVPAIVGQVMGYLTVTLGLVVDPEFEGALTAVLGVAFTGLYYLIVRVIEMKFPWVGVLIGWAKSPDSYSRGPGVDVTSKPEGELNISVTTKSETAEPTTVTGHLANLNSSVLTNLDKGDAPRP